MKGNYKELHKKYPSVFYFESTYGFIPDRIACANITFDKNDLETAISPKAWVIDNLLSAFLMLLNQSTVLSLHTAFITMLRQSIRLKYIRTHGDFLRYFFARNLNEKLNQLKTSQTVLMAVFSSKLKNKKDGTKEYFGNHWSLAVLHKETDTLRLYDSAYKELGFEQIILDLFKLANSISSIYNLTQAAWLLGWTYSNEVYSVQQENGYDCEIFVPLNTFHKSLGIAKPRLISGDHVSNVYRHQLVFVSSKSILPSYSGKCD